MYASNYYNHLIETQKIQNSYSQLSKGKKIQTDPIWANKQ